MAVGIEHAFVRQNVACEHQIVDDRGIEWRLRVPRAVGTPDAASPASARTMIGLSVIPASPINI